MIQFLFQLPEEKADEEGLSGAQRMVDDGAMEGVGAVLALRVYGGSPVDHITLDAGPSSAGVDSLRATITGSGSHGAYPHKGLDPIQRGRREKLIAPTLT